MPFMKLNRRAKQMGVQTFERASRLPPEIYGDELDYLKYRDWYIDMVGAKAQYEEALAQAKAAGDKEAIVYYGDKIHTISARLADARERVKSAGAGTWCSCFYQLALRMLSQEALIALEEETDRYMGRPRHELTS